MKTTIEIADNLLIRARNRAREQRTTLRSLVEQGLAAILDEPVRRVGVKPVTFKGNGLSPEFEGASWEKIRDTIHP